MLDQLIKRAALFVGILQNAHRAKGDHAPILHRKLQRSVGRQKAAALTGLETDAVVALDIGPHPANQARMKDDLMRCLSTWITQRLISVYLWQLDGISITLASIESH